MKKIIPISWFFFLWSCSGLVDAPYEPEESDAESDRMEDQEGREDGRDVQADDGLEETACTADGPCSDGNICNGEETCDPATHRCAAGTAPPDGFACGGDPRRICLSRTCVESICGDGFVDTGAGESCEPPGEGRCGSTCTVPCAGDDDCPDDGNVCNGEEYCSMDEQRCRQRNPLPDGSPCAGTPGRICVFGSCQESVCGDGFADGGMVPPEECDDGNATEGDGCDPDCSYSCHTDEDCDDGRSCSDDRCQVWSTHTCVSLPSPAGTLCRPAEGPCDAEDRCDGVSPDCPADVVAPGGTPCSDGDRCTRDDACDGRGACTGVPLEGCSCSHPVDLTATPSWNGSLADYADLFEGGTGCRYAGGSEIWFRATSHSGLRFLLQETSSTDVVMHQVESCASTSCLRSTDDPDQLAFVNGTGEDVPILIVVEGYSSTETGPVRLTATEDGTPHGDECADAIDIGTASDWSGTFYDYNDLWEGGSGCLSASGPEAWFSVTVENGRRLLFEEVSDTDAVLHRVDACGTTRCQDSSDLDEQLGYYNDTGSSVTLTFAVEGYYTSEDGPIALHVVRDVPPQGFRCASAVDASALSSWSGSYHDYNDIWEGGSGCLYAGGPEVWFTAAVPAGNTFTLRETSSTDVVIHRVASCASTTCLWSSDLNETFTYANTSGSSAVLHLVVERYFSGSEDPIVVSITNAP
jgi:cysteine-rich repeat protein